MTATVASISTGVAIGASMIVLIVANLALKSCSYRSSSLFHRIVAVFLVIFNSLFSPIVVTLLNDIDNVTWVLMGVAVSNPVLRELTKNGWRLC